MATHNHYPKSEVKLDTTFPTPQKPAHNTIAGPGPLCDQGRDKKYHLCEGKQGPVPPVIIEVRRNNYVTGKVKIFPILSKVDLVKF